MSEQRIIPSFQIDHDSHLPGFYLSKAANIGGNTIYTYDLRFVLPNGGDYLSYPSIHSIEHLLAVALRRTPQADAVLYFGPMGCRTGFYMLTADIPKAEALQLLITSIKDALSYDSLPGASRKECGNYIEHDFQAALTHLQSYLNIIS